MKKSDVIALFGNAQRVARALGLTTQAVSAWREDNVPAAHQFQLERMTNHVLVADCPLPPWAMGLAAIKGAITHPPQVVSEGAFETVEVTHEPD